MSTNLRVRHEGNQVQLIHNGRLVLEIPYEHGRDVANAIKSCALKAEEWINAERIAMDQAILTRAGFPIGLSNHPDIKNEAAKLAAWDRDIRRFMPGGVKSSEVLGTPAIIQSAPTQ